MTETKIKNNSVWIAIVDKKGNVSNMYIPLLDVEIAEGRTLGAYLEENEKEKQELRKEVEELKRLTEKVDNLERVIEDTIRGFITK